MASLVLCSRYYQMKSDVRMKICGDDVRRTGKEEGRYVILEVLHVGKTIRGCTKSALKKDYKGFGMADRDCVCDHFCFFRHPHQSSTALCKIMPL